MASQGFFFDGRTPILLAMVAFLSVLLVVVLLIVLGVLMTGVIIFARGGEVNRRWSNRLMNLRVATQAVAVLILGLILLLRNS